MEDILSQLARTKSSSALLRREFKISGQSSEPGQTENLTFVSLMHQIDSGLKRVHYKEKTASEVYQQLATVCQHSSGESPQQFLFRALDLRNKVNFASK